MSDLQTKAREAAERYAEEKYGPIGANPEGVATPHLDSVEDFIAGFAAAEERVKELEAELVALTPAPPQSCDHCQRFGPFFAHGTDHCTIPLPTRGEEGGK